MTAIQAISFLSLLRCLCLAIGLLTANLVAAQEGGSITITLPGEQLELPLNAGHSDWTGSTSFAKVSILARPTNVATWQRFQSLRLAFDLLRSGAQLPEMSVLRRADDAGFERLYGRSEQGGLSVIITDRAFDGAVLMVSGTFSGTLGPSIDFGQNIDLSAPLPISGRFDVTLLPIR